MLYRALPNRCQEASAGKQACRAKDGDPGAIRGEDTQAESRPGRSKRSVFGKRSDLPSR